MTGQEARDLSLLGLETGAAMPEIRAAYRRLVRRLHPDVCADDRRANAKLAAVNAAYGRLCALERRGYTRWSPETVFDRARARAAEAERDRNAEAEAARHRAAAKAAARVRAERARQSGPREFAFDAALCASLAAFAERKRSQEAFYRLKQRRGGVYPDPRRCAETPDLDLPGLASATRLRIEAGTLHVHVSGACKSGRNIVVLPEIVVGAGGGLRIGRTPQSFQFSCKRGAGTVRLHPSQAPIAGLGELRVQIHYEMATESHAA